MKEHDIIQETTKLLSNGWKFICLFVPFDKQRGKMLYESYELSADILWDFSMKYTISDIVLYGKTFIIRLEESQDHQTNLSWEVIDLILGIPNKQLASF